jgi:hypothetical protein
LVAAVLAGAVVVGGQEAVQLQAGGDGQRLAGLHAERLHVQRLEPGHDGVELERHVQALRLLGERHGRLCEHVPVLVHGGEAEPRRCVGHQVQQLEALRGVGAVAIDDVHHLL